MGNAALSGCVPAALPHRRTRPSRSPHSSFLPSSPLPSPRFALKYDTEGYGCDLTRKLWKAGHEIALHTADHVRLDMPIDAEKECECLLGGGAGARAGVRGCSCGGSGGRDAPGACLA